MTTETGNPVVATDAENKDINSSFTETPVASPVKEKKINLSEDKGNLLSTLAKMWLRRI